MRQYIYFNWIFWYTDYSNGYHFIDGYPYWVYNGYRQPYSKIDKCNYQLVDTYNHCIVRDYWNQYCNIGYDSCSSDRDSFNYDANEERFFCAITHRETSYKYFNRYSNNVSYRDIQSSRYCGTEDGYYYDDENDPYYDYDYDDDEWQSDY